MLSQDIHLKEKALTSRSDESSPKDGIGVNPVPSLRLEHTEQTPDGKVALWLPWVLPEAGSIHFSVPRRQCVLSDRGPGLGAWELWERGPGSTPALHSSSPPTLGSEHSSCPGSSSAVAATAMPAAASGGSGVDRKWRAPVCHSVGAPEDVDV